MADLELSPDYQFQTTKKYDTLITSFESGVEQRRAKRANPVTEFTLQFRNRAAADLTTIDNLFAAQKGAFTTFTWLNPEDSVTYTVRFKEDSFRKVLVHYGIWDFEFTLTTVL